MNYIKIPLEHYTMMQIDSIKKNGNSKLNLNLNDEDIIVSAINLLHTLSFIHFDMISEDRLNKHLNPIIEIISNNQSFLKYIANASKNHDNINRVLYNNKEKLNKLGVSI